MSCVICSDGVALPVALVVPTVAEADCCDGLGAHPLTKINVAVNKHKNIIIVFDIGFSFDGFTVIFYIMLLLKSTLPLLFVLFL